MSPNLTGTESVLPLGLSSFPTEESHASDQPSPTVGLATSASVTAPKQELSLSSATSSSNRSAPPFVSHRGLFRNSLIIGLAFIVIIGGYVLLSPFIMKSTRPSSAPSTCTAHPTSSIDTTLSDSDLDLQHTGFLPNEHILSPSNVSQLVQGQITTVNPLETTINGVAYTISSNGKMAHASQTTTGASLWTSAPFSGSILSLDVVKGFLYVSTDDHALSALNTVTGACLWTASFSSPVISPVQQPHFPVTRLLVARGIIYIGSDDHKLYAFNATTGARLWSASTSNTVDSLLSDPAVANGIVYVGSHDRTLYAFNALTGAALWSTLTGSITAPPSVANGVVYVTTIDGHNLTALDVMTGKIRWAVYVGGPAQVTPAVANGRVYATSTDHQVHAFNAATGASLWTSTSITPVNTSDAFLFSDAVVANGVVYITSDEINISGNSTTSGDYSRLYAFHAMTGAPLWSSALFKGTQLSTPMIDNGVVSVNSFSGNQTLYQASNKYTFHLPGTAP